MLAAEQIVRVLGGPSSLAAMLPDYLRGQRWFGGKAQPIRAVSLVDVIRFDSAEIAAVFLLVRVDYHDAAAEVYSLPMIAADGIATIPHSKTGEPAPHLLVTSEGANAVLYDAFRHAGFLDALLAAVRDGRSFRGERGEMRAAPTAVLGELLAEHLPARVMRAEQSNTSVVYGDRLVLKLFRRLAEGVNPDVEIGRFLTGKTSFRHVPLLAGAIEYINDAGVSSSAAILQSFVHNQGDAWEFTLRAVGRYFGSTPQSLPDGAGDWSLMQWADQELPQSAWEAVGEYMASAELLGRRTAELHLALSSHAGDPAFEPEPYTAADQREFCESATQLLHRNLDLLLRQTALPRATRLQAENVLARAAEIEERFRQFERHPLSALRTRIHGDYHLGQVLVSDGDFIIIDFEGEPARSLAERRRKRSPLQDVAGLLRSFHYAAFAPLLGTGPDSLTLERQERSARAWQMRVSAAFLREYLAIAGSSAFLPREPWETEALLNAHLLEKAVYELGYELNNRPTWVRVPLSGIEQLLKDRPEAFGEWGRRIA
jgi:trehalose synthase-fused probable maltokinase